MPKKSEIKIHIELDDNKVPSKIEWEATEAGLKEPKEALSFMLSLWDKAEKSTLGIDLWTKEMLVEDMNIHVHQVFLKLADTYRRATKNEEVFGMINNFAADFAEKLDLKNKVKKS